MIAVQVRNLLSFFILISVNFSLLSKLLITRGMWKTYRRSRERKVNYFQTCNHFQIHLHMFMNHAFKTITQTILMSHVLCWPLPLSIRTHTNSEAVKVLKIYMHIFTARSLIFCDSINKIWKMAQHVKWICILRGFTFETISHDSWQY